MTAPHDAPTAGQLIEAVREFLEGDVMTSTEGHLRFHARVAANVLAIVQRELDLGDGQCNAHVERLRALGFESDVDLAHAIREGAVDDRYDDVKVAVLAAVIDKLRVANPRYLED